MQKASIEVHGLHGCYDGQLALQTSVLVDRLRVGEAPRLGDRRCSMYPRAAALAVIRHARATLGWAADVRLIFRNPGVSLVSVLWRRAAGGW